MKFFTTLWYVIKLGVFFVLGMPFFMAAATVRLFSIWKSISINQTYNHIFFKMFGLNVQYEFQEIKTKEASNSVFVLLNQFSFLDSIIVPAIPVKKFRSIANIEFGLYPVIGWFHLITDFVIIRQWPKQAKDTLNRTAKFLRSGGNVFISIEGKRTKDGRLNKYKKGPSVMAINSQSDIIPMIIEGSYESLPYKSLYPKPGEIRVKIFSPIPTKGMTYENRDELVDRLRSIAHLNGLN